MARGAPIHEWTGIFGPQQLTYDTGGLRQVILEVWIATMSSALTLTASGLEAVCILQLYMCAM